MIEISGLDEFADKCKRAQQELKPFAASVLEEAGEELLDIIQDEIIAAKNVDTRLLLSSFSRGGADNVWELNTGALTLTVGTRVKYAAYVNDGHRQSPGRFVPGVWSGDHFTYIPGAKTGMVLKAGFVPGSHYFDKAVDVAERMLPKVMEARLQAWFDKFFG